MSGDSRSYQVVEGFKIPQTFSADRFRSAINYKPKAGDFFIATYPRCGTTWTQQIVYLIFHKGEAPANAVEFYKASPYIDMYGAEAIENMPHPGLIKVHVPFHLTPYSPEAKYIYVCRNPKDCAVSLYHFLTKTVSSAQFTFHEFFEKFIVGEIPYGDYFDNLASWYEHKDDPNVLFLTYEEMKENQEDCVMKIASFLGKEYEATLKEDRSLMDKILQKSSFDFMKKNLDKEMVKIHQLEEDTSKTTDLPEGLKEVLTRRGASGGGAFVRKGDTGGWKEYLTEEQSKRLDEKFAERMKGSSLESVWKNYMQ